MRGVAAPEAFLEPALEPSLDLGSFRVPAATFSAFLASRAALDAETILDNVVMQCGGDRSCRCQEKYRYRSVVDKSFGGLVGFFWSDASGGQVSSDLAILDQICSS